ncbi:MAG: CRISPR-associated endonuclease Cas2 [Candidatus Magnetomorum sp.]|nr:CRISPR-associated endonuclease Cas2 [Candidatus Magnetomorum sp.]
MNRRGWYMIAYDIANPKRLQKVHRRLKKKGIAAQKSVFFTRGTENDINELMDHIGMFMKFSEDDLRAYPIIEPTSIWTNGTNPIAQGTTLTFTTRQSNKTMKKTGKLRNKLNIKIAETIKKYFH